MKLRKIAAVSACVLLGLSVLAGCSSSQKSITAPTEEVAQKLQESLSFEYPLNQLSEDAANRLYKLEGGIIEEQSVYVGTGGALADEVSVWRVKDEKDAETVKEAAETRVENQKVSFKDYVPAEMPKLEKAVITVEGDTIILCVSADPDKAKEIIASFEE